MTQAKSESRRFDDGISKLLKADPKLVKAAMEQEKKEREEERKAKRSSSYDPASSTRDT